VTIASVSFNGGEVSDLMDGRPDLQRVKSGCKLLRNTVCLGQGPATRRAGLFFINASVETNVNNAVKLIPFNFSTVESRVLEFFDWRFRIIKDDEYVKLSYTPSAWATPVDYARGDVVREATRDFYCMFGHDSTDATKRPISGGQWELYWNELEQVGSDTIFEAFSPYSDDFLATLWYKQSKDIIYLANPNVKPVKISRRADDDWIFEYVDFIPDTEVPTGLGVTSTVGSATPNKRNYRYLITAIDADDGAESLVTEEVSISTSILNSIDGNYNTLWWWENVVEPLEYRIYRYEIGIYGYIGSTSHAPQLFLNEPPSNEVVALVAGTVYILMMEGTGRVTTTLDGGYAEEGIPLFWTTAGGNETFTISAGTCTRWQLTAALLFDDDNIAADIEDSPPEHIEPFVGAGNFPSIVFFWSQRLGWASTNNEPFTHWLSPKGLFESLAASVPPQPDDAITATLAVEQANKVQWVEGDRVLISGTTENEWALGKADEPLVPATADFYRQENVGSEPIPPLLIGSTILFVQRGGSVIQEISYAFTNDRYKAKDISIIASHLLDGKSVISWCYQKRPYSIVWMILSDNTLVAMTYMPNHDVIGWHRHDTKNGVLFDICCSNGDAEDIVTISLQRWVAFGMRRYNERLHSFFVRDSDPANAFFVDSGVKYNCYDQTAGNNLTLSDLTGSITATAVNDYFTAKDVGQSLVARDSIGTFKGSMTIVSVTAKVATGEVSWPFSGLTYSGSLWGVRGVEITDIAYHLRGETVKIWADGAEQAERVVEASGTVILDVPAEQVTIGLQMISDIIPTRPELSAQQGNTTLTKKYKISTAKLRLYKSMGVKVGKNEDQLSEIISHDAYDPRLPQLVSGDRDVSADTGWDDDEWEFLIRADGPAPMTISAIVYDVEVAEEI